MFFLVSGISFTFLTTETVLYYLKHILQLKMHIFMYFFQLRSLVKSISKNNLRTKRAAVLTMNCNFATVMLNDDITFRWCLSNQFLNTSNRRVCITTENTNSMYLLLKKLSCFCICFYFSYLLLVYNSFLLQFKGFVSCVITYRWENQIISLLTAFMLQKTVPFLLLASLILLLGGLTRIMDFPL